VTEMFSGYGILIIGLQSNSVYKPKMWPSRWP